MGLWFSFHSGLESFGVKVMLKMNWETFIFFYASHSLNWKCT